jgi:hypothetical protein
MAFRYLVYFFFLIFLLLVDFVQWTTVSMGSCQRTKKQTKEQICQYYIMWDNQRCTLYRIIIFRVDFVYGTDGAVSAWHSDWMRNGLAPCPYRVVRWFFTLDSSTCSISYRRFRRSATSNSKDSRPSLHIAFGDVNHATQWGMTSHFIVSQTDGSLLQCTNMAPYPDSFSGQSRFIGNGAYDVVHSSAQYLLWTLVGTLA